MTKDEPASVKLCSEKRAVSLDDALELAKSGQITGSSFREVAREISGPFWQQIYSIFHGHYLLVYVLTDHPRRAVWHAALSAGQDDLTHFRTDASAQSEMLRRFLHDSSEDLIAAALGSCPRGYLSILKRLPQKAERDVTVFRQLHQLLSDHPHLGPQLCNHGRVSSGLVALLAMLPAPLKHVRVAELFDGDPQTYRRWMEVYRVLTGEDDLLPVHVASLMGGEKPGMLIQRIYHAILFPAPFLPHTDRIKHLHNGAAMVAAAARYENCLRNWIAEAHRNQQFYEVVLADGSIAVLSLKNDGPAGRLLDDVKLANNGEIDDVLQDELREYLGRFGVRVGPSLEAMMRRFARHDLGEMDVNPFEVDADLFDAMDDWM